MRYLIAFSFFLLGCEKLFKDDVLSIPQTGYQGTQLRIDGYYYMSNPNSSYVVYIFYGNGTVLSAGSFISSNLPKVEETLQDPAWISANKEYKYDYGRFLIEGDSIRFERWYPGSPPLPAYVRAGNILNDTTFVVKEVYRMKNGEKTEEESGRNETYHFKQFSPKPDSTNQFVP